jgi:two-component system phosphate regulon sensor histidine kinase PhoR
METQSIFSRLLIVSLILLLCAGAFIFYQTNYRAGDELIREFQEREGKTLEIAHWLVAGKAPYRNLDELRDYVRELSKRFGLRITYISDGKVLAESDLPPEEAAQMENHSARPEIVAALQNGSGASSRYSATLHRDMLYVATRMQETPGLPDGVLRIAVPYSSVQKMLGDSRENFLIVVAAMVVCASALAVFLIRRTQGMLRSFSQEVDVLGSEQSPDKIRVCPGSEFKPLMDSINVLAKKARKNTRHLQDTRSQFEAVLAKMTDAVAVLDENGTIIAHNHALDRMLGDTAKDCTGSYVLEAGLGLDVHEAVKGCLAAVNDAPRRFLARLDNGGHADVDLVPYKTARGKYRLILVLHDVSAMKDAERILREFVINASHQLRTPLTSIQGYTATLIDTPPQDEGQARTMLETILRRSREMGDVVTELLNTASPQAGKTTDPASAATEDSL